MSRRGRHRSTEPVNRFDGQGVEAYAPLPSITDNRRVQQQKKGERLTFGSLSNVNAIRESHIREKTPDISPSGQNRSVNRTVGPPRRFSPQPREHQSNASSTPSFESVNSQRSTVLVVRQPVPEEVGMARTQTKTIMTTGARRKTPVPESRRSPIPLMSGARGKTPQPPASHMAPALARATSVRPVIPPSRRSVDEIIDSESDSEQTPRRNTQPAARRTSRARSIVNSHVISPGVPAPSRTASRKSVERRSILRSPQSSNISRADSTPSPTAPEVPSKGKTRKRQAARQTTPRNTRARSFVPSPIIPPAPVVQTRSTRATSATKRAAPPRATTPSTPAKRNRAPSMVQANYESNIVTRSKSIARKTRSPSAARMKNGSLSVAGSVGHKERLMDREIFNQVGGYPSITNQIRKLYVPAWKTGMCNVPDIFLSNSIIDHGFSDFILSPVVDIVLKST